MMQPLPESMMGPTLDRRKFLKRALYATGAAGTLGAGLSLFPRVSELVAPETRPAIVLITLDTTRADHLSCYGYPRKTCPNLDRLAAESLVFEKAISPATWTLPAHASLFTGKFAATHGVCKAIDGVLNLVVSDYGPEAVNHYRAHPMAAGEHTLAMLLRDAGYRTSAVVAGPWLKRVFGMDRGFEEYDDNNIETVNARPADQVTDRAIELLSEPCRQPRFLFLNYFDAHFPYQPPKEFTQLYSSSDLDGRRPGAQSSVDARTNLLYDAEIRFMDQHLGRLFEELKRLGIYDDAWIIVTADHGEMLGEHGVMGHPGVVYQEAVHIPLIVKHPRAQQKTGRVDGWIQLIDLFPMVLAAARVAPPAGIQGQLPGEIEHPILIESRTLEGINSGGDWFAVISDDWKFVFSTEGNHMLFNLQTDSREQRNLFAVYPNTARRLDDLMHEYLAGLPEAPARNSIPIDKPTQAQLKSLGYVR
jgi:arylsulfatase A-like enzyme